MNEIKNFEQYIDIASIHASRIKTALEKLALTRPITLFFITTATFEKLGYIEFALHRFAKLQDLLGSKIFPFIVVLLGENTDNQTYIDTLNILEKFHLLPSTQEWLKWRTIRNDLAHDYPGDNIKTILETNKAIDTAEQLLSYWEILLPKIQTLVQKYKMTVKE